MQNFHESSLLSNLMFTDRNQFKNLLWGCAPREQQFLQVPSYRQVAKSDHLSDKLIQFKTWPLRLQSFDAMTEII